MRFNVASLYLLLYRLEDRRAIGFVDAITRAYAGVTQIRFDGMQFRHDIGKKALVSDTVN